MMRKGGFCYFLFGFIFNFVLPAIGMLVMYGDFCLLIH